MKTLFLLQIATTHLGSIHNWVTKKECLIFKRLQRTTLDFSSICSIIIVTMDFYMPISKMMSC